MFSQMRPKYTVNRRDAALAIGWGPLVVTSIIEKCHGDLYNTLLAVQNTDSKPP